MARIKPVLTNTEHPEDDPVWDKLRHWEQYVALMCRTTSHPGMTPTGGATLMELANLHHNQIHSISSFVATIGKKLVPEMHEEHIDGERPSSRYRLMPGPKPIRGRKPRKPGRRGLVSTSEWYNPDRKTIRELPAKEPDRADLQRAFELAARKACNWTIEENYRRMFGRIAGYISRAYELSGLPAAPSPASPNNKISEIRRRSGKLSRGRKGANKPAARTVRVDAELLERLRELEGKTQQKFAEPYGIPRTTYSAILKTGLTRMETAFKLQTGVQSLGRLHGIPFEITSKFILGTLPLRAKPGRRILA